MIRAGELRTRLVLMQPANWDDERWGRDGDFLDCGEIWAKLTPTQSTEKANKGDVQETNTYTCIMRYRELTTKWRLRIRGAMYGNKELKDGRRIFEIIGITDPDSRKRELHLTLVEHPQEVANV